ncbi:MAG: DNA/RNA nuclease SfsA [Vicinamibacteria bacterium]
MRAKSLRIMSRFPDAPFYSLQPATFVSRPNRFVIIARHRNQTIRAACPDPGRLAELLVPGVRVLLEPASRPGRCTSHTIILVRHRARWVSLFPALANRIFEAALRRDGVPGLRNAKILAREVPCGQGRIDFVVSWRGRKALLEVKSATLVAGGRALFPDAPTARGRRHLQELTAHSGKGGQAVVVFIVQRDDARSLSPHAANDPAFAAALSDAARAGVRVLAFACRVTPDGIRLDRRIPVVM